MRRLVATGATAVVVAAALLSGAGAGASATAAPETHWIPAGLAAAIHARLGAAPIRLASSGWRDHPQLGTTVALSADGTTALVSAHGVGNERGAVYIYRSSGGADAWATSSKPAATLSPKAGAKPQAFGSGIALSADGTTAFVGAPFGGAEAVYVFHVADESAWVSTSIPQATLTVSGGSIGDSVAASSDGTTIITGTPFYGNEIRAAYVFHVASEDAWASTAVPTATLTYSHESRSDTAYGPAIAISGDGTTALLGDSEAHKFAGATYLFHVASESAWATTAAPEAILSNAKSVANDRSAIALALSGDGTTVFVGSPFVKKQTGEVDVFHAASADAWASTSTPAAVLTGPAGARSDFFGGRLAVSDDGATAAIGAPGIHHNTGVAYVFHATGAGAWTSSSAPAATLTDSAGIPNDELGVGLGMSPDGATLLVGAPWVDWKTGAVDVFHVADASSWLTSSKPGAKLTNEALPKPVCLVPPLKGAPVAAARFILSYENCRLGKVTRVHAATRMWRRRIVSQSRAPGSRLRPGSKINVAIGK